jgi:hypothetical protein
MQKRTTESGVMESSQSRVFSTVINMVFRTIVFFDIELCIKTQSESELAKIKEY